jgi:Family of unknown function (DUF6680)
MNPTSEIFGWSILAATFLGPIAAVMMTRYIDRQRERNARRLWIFRTLMATRRTWLSAEHIAALNQIELDFQKDVGVMNAYRMYMKHLTTPFEPKDNDRVGHERQSMRTKILSEMAKTLGIRVEQLDIFEGGYVPQGHVDIEREQASIRKLLLEIADGKRSLPIEVRTGALPQIPMEVGR